MAPDPNERKWIVGIVAFAIVSRALYLFHFLSRDPFASYLIHDARRYHEWASALAGGTAWETGPFYQAPLYPYALSFLYRLFGAAPAAAYLLQAAGGVALILLVRRIAGRTFGSNAGLWAAGLAALYGVFPFYETKLVPGAAAALLATWAIDRLQIAHEEDRYTQWLLAGAVIGLGALVQPGSLLLAPGVALWLTADGSKPWSGRLQRLAWIGIAVILVLAPASAYNRFVGGDAALISTNGGVTFYQGNNESARGVFSVPPGFSGAIRNQREESRQLAQASRGRELRDSEVSRYWFDRGLSFIAEHPASWLNLVSLKAGLALSNYDQPLEYNAQLDSNPFRRLMPLGFAWILALAAARLVSGPSFRQVEMPLWISVAASLGMLLLFYVSGRYRLPLTPALLALAGAGAAGLVEGRRRLTAVAVATVALALSFGLTPLRQPELRRSVEVTGWCDRGEAYAATGQPERAVELYRHAAALDPTYPFAQLDLSKLLSRMGRQDDAIAAATEAARLAPQLSEPQFDLGVLLFESERLDEAASRFAEALRLDPRNAAAGNNLLGTQLRLGRVDRAVETWKTMRRTGLPVDPPLEAWLRDRGLVP